MFSLLQNTLLQPIVPMSNMGLSDMFNQPQNVDLLTLAANMQQQQQQNSFAPDMQYNGPGVQAPANLSDIINGASAKFGIPNGLLNAVIKQESDFNPRSLSHAGAMGYMQLMPDTAKEVGVTNPWDATQNIYGGAQYLRKMYNATGDWRYALAAYNAGLGRVKTNAGLRIPNIKETQDYVRKVMNYWGYR